MYVTLTPAYGRDYNSGAAAISDYHNGKDFIVQAFGIPEKPINKEQCIAEGFKVSIRYNNNRKIVSVD